ncbi:MAG: class II glutamine amidotransferase [Actinomycetota bacterium]
MCRWLVYSGSPIRLEEVLSKPANSLIEQSMHARMGVEPTNGDGFGVGWYDEGGSPVVFRGTGPAWNDRNLRALSGHIESSLFLAHIRASTGTAVQQTNCHPFQYGKWLWVHNGLIRDFAKVKRDLVLAVDPDLYRSIEGSTDSELMLFLALTFGLDVDPPGAVERMVGFVEEVGHRHGVEQPIQMTVGATDGDRVWAFRYSSERESRSLFFSTDLATLREMHPDFEFGTLSDETRLVVSEPLGDLVGAWNEVPESSYGIIQKGADELKPFKPQTP